MIKISWSLFWRLLFHCLLVTLITIKVIDWNVIDASYGRSLKRTFNFLFGTDAMVESLNNNQIYTFDEFDTALEKVFYTYQNIKAMSIASLSYGYRDQNYNVNCKQQPETITTTTYYWADSTHIHSSINEFSDIEDLKLLMNNESLFFDHLDSMHLAFDLCSYQPQSTSYLESSKCNYWEIHVHYKFIAQLYIEVSVESSMQKSCSAMTTKESFTDFITSLEVITFFICIAYATFLFRDIKIAAQLYFQVKEAHGRARLKYLRDPSLCSEIEAVAAQYEWREIPIGIKRSFHSYWSLMTLLGVIFTFIDSGYTLAVSDYRYVDYASAGKALSGLSCFLLWSTLVQFIYYFPSLYAMAVTVQTALPRILAFLLGFMPIYFAFVFLGIGLFGYKLGMFSSLSLASGSMFAFVNGDCIRPILHLMEHRSYVAAVMYGVIFILLTTYLLLNILIAIVEEAYFLSRKKSRFLEYLMWKNLQSMVSNTNGGNKFDSDSMKKEVFRPIEDEEHEFSDEEDEWIQNVYSSIYTRSMPKVTPEDLNITLAEEAAEMYILGKTHWEYSKVVNHIFSIVYTIMYVFEYLDDGLFG